VNGPWTRRRFALAAGAWAAAAHRIAAQDPALRVGWWEPGAGVSPAYEQGLLLGAEEMGRTAELLGGSLEVERARGPLREALPRLERAAVLIAAAPPHELALPAAARGGARISVAPGEADEEVEGVLRVGWPESWRRAALAPRNAAAGAAALRALDWHPSLERYGAAQLNERFSRRFGAPMTEEAWRAWVAVKAAAEAMLRSPARDPDAALRGLVLDGHHGRALRFSRAGLLLHPAYLAASPAAGTIVATVPLPEAK
jgi:hypothetical protein